MFSLHVNFPPPCVLVTLPFEFKKYIFETKLKHLIEETFEHRNTNSFKLSVCLFYFGKRTRISGYNLMRNNPQTRSYSLIRNIYRSTTHVFLLNIITHKLYQIVGDETPLTRFCLKTPLRSNVLIKLLKHYLFLHPNPTKCGTDTQGTPAGGHQFKPPTEHRLLRFDGKPKPGTLKST